MKVTFSFVLRTPNFFLLISFRFYFLILYQRISNAEYEKFLWMEISEHFSHQVSIFVMCDMPRGFPVLPAGAGNTPLLHVLVSILQRNRSYRYIFTYLHKQSLHVIYTQLYASIWTIYVYIYLYMHIYLSIYIFIKI